MEQWDKRLISALDSVHAEATLKESAKARIQSEREKTSAKRFWGSLRPAAALASIALVFFSGYFCRMYLEPVCVISIDINPSIELSVNTFDRVIRVDAFNEDGRELTDHLQLRFLDYQDAVDRIVTSETVTGLLNQAEELAISVIGEDEDRNERLCESLEHHTQSSGSGHCYTAPLHTLETAHSCGMSYGKYMAYQEALLQEENITAEAVQDMTMKEIRELTEETCHTEPVCEESEHHAETTEQYHGHNGNQNENKHKKGHH